MDSPISYPCEQEFTRPDVTSLINLGDQNQYEGNYQEATKNYLQALEFLYQILDNDTKYLQEQNNLTSLRGIILSKLGDNLVYVGQYKIAVEFYGQQLRIVTGVGSKLDIALAHHKVGFCHYFMGLYESSIEHQKQSLGILSTEEEKLEFKKLKCKIHLCLGLNQCALKSHEMAANSYEEALNIARRYGLQNEEAEIIATLSSSIREKLNLEYGQVNLYSLEKLIGDLYYAIRIAHNNPYIRALALRELAKVYESTDIDIAKSRPPSNRNLLGLFEQAHEWEFSRPDGSPCKLIPAPVLSGDKLVDNSEFKADLFKRFPHAKGGEMEGIGFCSAANSLQKPWILIKAICDWADGKKNDKHQPLAAAAAVSLVHYVLSQKTILNCFE